MNALASRLVRLTNGNSSALVYPERGFQLMGYATPVKGVSTEVIYAPTANREAADRRYGNPVLFPVCGVSHGEVPDSWDHGGRSLPMPAHGWARNVYWQVEAVDGQSITATLVPHPGFRLGFPFDFALTMTYRLETDALVLSSTLVNQGQETFPYALGFHPYLQAPGARGEVAIPAGTRLRSADSWRTVTAVAEPARLLKLDDPELPGSIVLQGTQATELELRDPAAGVARQVSVAGSAQPFPVWVVWNAGIDAPYVCLEPWTDAPNALNRSATRTLAPGETHHHRMALSARAL